MLSSEMMQAGFSAFLPKFVFALCLATCMLRVCDRRASALQSIIALSFLATMASAFEGWQETEISSAASWYTAAFFAALHLVIVLRRWASIRPRQLHEEQKQGTNALTNKEKRKQKAELRGKQYSTPFASASPIELGMLFVAILSACYGLVQDWREMRLTGDAGIYAAMATTANTGLWATAMVSALELTFLSSPLNLSPQKGPRVSWTGIASFGLTAFVLCLMVSSLMLLRENGLDRNDRLIDQAVPKVFALTWMILGCIVWIVPHRVRSFQKCGTAKEWTTLALTSWIGLVCFSIIAALPNNWPWHLI